MKANDYTKTKPVWCPGCGYFGILRALHQTFADLNLKQEDILIVSGIGCSGKFSSATMSYGFHGVHGRLLPVAIGAKLSNSDLTVVGIGGDGDGFSIGLSHFIHAVRRNVRVVYISTDNHVYGLTKGQTSPTSDPSFKTKTTPYGPEIEPVHPLLLSLSSGGTFVSQAFAGDIKEMVDIFKQALNYDGFAYVNVLSPCVTYNHVNTYDWYRQNIIKLNTLPDYDPHSIQFALSKAADFDHVYTGIFYIDKNKKPYNLNKNYMPDKPIAKQPLRKDENIDLYHILST